MGYKKFYKKLRVKKSKQNYIDTKGKKRLYLAGRERSFEFYDALRAQWFARGAVVDQGFGFLKRHEAADGELLRQRLHAAVDARPGYGAGERA